MGMLSDFLFADKPNVEIDMTLLPETVKQYLCYNLSFDSNMFSSTKRARGATVSQLPSHANDNTAAVGSVRSTGSSGKIVELVAGAAKIAAAAEGDATAVKDNAAAASFSSNRLQVPLGSDVNASQGVITSALTGIVAELPQPLIARLMWKHYLQQVKQSKSSGSPLQFAMMSAVYSKEVAVQGALHMCAQGALHVCAIETLCLYYTIH